MKVSRAGFLLAIGTALLGLAWAFFVARDRAWDRMQALDARLRELTYADFMLDLEVLRVRSGVIHHYDHVSEASHKLRAAAQSLSAPIEEALPHAAMDQAMASLQDSVRSKIAFVETIQAQNSILRNSESYLPSLLDEFGKRTTEERAHAVRGLFLRTLVLTDPEAGQELRRQLESLLATPEQWDWDDITSKVALHGLKTLEVRQSMQPMLHEFLNIPVHEAITQLNQIVMREQEAQERARQGSRNILYLTAFGFFLLSLLMLLRFIRLNQKIRSFVPYEMLNLLGKKTLLDIEYGTSIQREMTVMFVDLRDFSRTCESRTPAENFAFVNEYLATITPAIERHQGFVSQFSGDGFLALFPGSADDALSAALALTRALSELNRKRHERGEETLSFGIGINTSELMLGAIGHQKRMECSVLGNGVNIAARVEGLTRIYGCEILLTGSTVQRLHQPAAFHLRVIDHVRPKGLQEAFLLHELLESGHSSLLRDAEFQEGRRLYQMRRFHEAAAIFSRLSADDPVSALYRSRCRELEHALDAKWDGIADFSVK